MTFTQVSSVITGIKGIVNSITGYTELSNPLDPQKKAYRSASNKYGVRSLSLTEIEGSTRHNWYDVALQVELVKTINQVRGNSNADDIEIELQQYLVDVYKSCINTKCGVTSIVHNVKEFSTNESEILEDDNLISVKATFTVTINQGLD